MKRRHDRRRIERLLDRRIRHDLTFREISEESGIPVPTLSYWSRKLHEEDEEGEFVSVEVEEEESETITIEVGERFRVLVERGFDEIHLARVFELLRTRC